MIQTISTSLNISLSIISNNKENNKKTCVHTHNKKGPKMATSSHQTGKNGQILIANFIVPDNYNPCLINNVIMHVSGEYEINWSFNSCENMPNIFLTCQIKAR